MPEHVLFLGLSNHSAMQILFQRLQMRGNCRPIYLPLDDFPREPGFHLLIGPEHADGRFYIPPDELVAFSDIAAVVADGLPVPAEYAELKPEDKNYMQTEAWAALQALCLRLSDQALVANHVTNRDLLLSRLSELWLLRRNGLEVPDVLVTSLPDAAAEFCRRHPQVIFRPVSGHHQPFKPVDEGVLRKLSRVRLAPVHFEQVVRGDLAVVVKIGARLMVNPPQAMPPAEVLGNVTAALEETGVELGEVVLLRQGKRWLAQNLIPFVTEHSLANHELRDSVCDWLERGGD